MHHFNHFLSLCPAFQRNLKNLLTPVWGLKNFNFSRCLWALQYLRGQTGKNSSPCSEVATSNMVRQQRQLISNFLYWHASESPCLPFALTSKLQWQSFEASLHKTEARICTAEWTDWKHWITLTACTSAFRVPLAPSGQDPHGIKNHTAKPHKISHPCCKTYLLRLHTSSNIHHW